MRLTLNFNPAAWSPLRKLSAEKFTGWSLPEIQFEGNEKGRLSAPLLNLPSLP
ncbi:hypothetical protein DEALK_08300 [Dehalogenimonas alkenigignens]|uniref:Uncharacterized protein n=1 Tax=Dehalogenimonas alkenigignens TaxID=1217799 RepID=A0A0W0GHG9_9CHLR|nr:hypothetical protein DEALK_08300 [Dehalogenimonas alkenigignens]